MLEYKVKIKKEICDTSINVIAVKQQSTCFDYGSKTVIFITTINELTKEENEYAIDVRYTEECSTAKGFEEWVSKWCKENWGDNAEYIKKITK